MRKLFTNLFEIQKYGLKPIVRYANTGIHNGYFDTLLWFRIIFQPYLYVTAVGEFDGVTRKI